MVSIMISNIYLVEENIITLNEIIQSKLLFNQLFSIFNSKILILVKILSLVTGSASDSSKKES